MCVPNSHNSSFRNLFFHNLLCAQTNSLWQGAFATILPKSRNFFRLFCLFSCILWWCSAISFLDFNHNYVSALKMASKREALKIPWRPRLTLRHCYLSFVKIGETVIFGRCDKYAWILHNVPNELWSAVHAQNQSERTHHIQSSRFHRNAFNNNNWVDRELKNALQVSVVPAIAAFP